MARSVQRGRATRSARAGAGARGGVGTWPPDAQAVIIAPVQQVVALAAEVRDLQARLGQNSTNSSRGRAMTQTTKRMSAREARQLGRTKSQDATTTAGVFLSR